MKLFSPSDPELDLPNLEPACAACQESLVAGTLPRPEEVVVHLQGCLVCREFQGYLPLLHNGLAALPQAIADVEAIDRTLHAVLKDRRNRFRRQLLVAVSGVAVAASIAIGVFVLAYPPQKSRAPFESQQAQVVPSLPPDTQPATNIELRETILDARSSVVSNLKRTADETVESTLSLIPDSLPMPSPDPISPLEPALANFSNVGHSAAMSVQPLTDSARRAVGLFWKELPSID